MSRTTVSADSAERFVDDGGDGLVPQRAGPLPVEQAAAEQLLEPGGEFANVVMKLGGMTMRLAAYDYRTEPAPPTSAHDAEHSRPYMETCIEVFGASRCMFESNFPVEKMGISWVPLWRAFKRITAGASAEEKRALFSGTAKRT